MESIDEFVQRKRDEIISYITSFRKSLVNDFEFWSIRELNDETKRKLKEKLEGIPFRNVFGETIYPKVEFYFHRVWGTIINIFTEDKPQK